MRPVKPFQTICESHLASNRRGVALGPYVVAVKTHIDFISDFSPKTTEGLSSLAEKHGFLIFEDRKFVDIGSTARIQYSRGDRRIHEWAHIVNACVLAGEGTVQAIDQAIKHHPSKERGILILAEMTSKGSTAVGPYTQTSVNIARGYSDTVMGFVATRELSSVAVGSVRPGEDFVIFTTGVNISTKGDALGQQYQTPTTAVQGGADFLIVGRGIYAAADPVAAIQEYRQAGWEAYLRRTRS